MRWILIQFIKIYQKVLSPDHSWLKYRYPYGFCRFYPSCSQYAVGALENNSLPRALVKIVVRIIKCNPFTRPKVDVSYKENNV